mgnify:CR=1 FL=1
MYEASLPLKKESHQKTLSLRKENNHKTLQFKKESTQKSVPNLNKKKPNIEEDKKVINSKSVKTFNKDNREKKEKEKAKLTREVSNIVSPKTKPMPLPKTIPRPA